MNRTVAVMLHVALAVLLAGLACAQQVTVEASYGKGANVFSLATGSPGELGLLGALGEAFAVKNNARMDWVKAGSGEGMALLQNKRVDMIMVHAPAAEKKAVADGWAVKRTLIGSNEFFLVGPAKDPANVRQAANIADAYQRIAGARSPFVSRGDNSGTHKKEMDIWKAAGIQPQGEWYVVTKDYMTASLKRAEALGGYFMTDSSTWVAEKKNLPGLTVLFSGDKVLVNTYHALCQPAGVTPGAATAARFIDFVASPEGQAIIAGYGAQGGGEGLYNDAAYARKYDD